MINKNSLFFLVVAAAIVLLTIIAHLRQVGFTELEPPEGRVNAISTVGDRLVAVSDVRDVRVWKWDELSAPPQKAHLEAECVTFIAPEELLSAPPGGEALLISRIGSDKLLHRTLVPYGWRCKLLRTTRNGQFTAAGLAPGSLSKGRPERLALAVFDAETRKMTMAATFNAKGEDFSLGDVSVCEAGDMAAISGSAEGGWVAVVDVAAQRVLWEKSFEQIPGLDVIRFSPDSRTLYVAGQSTQVIALDTEGGHVLQQWEIGTSKKEEVGLKFVYVMAIAVSPDGRRIAATGVNTRIYLWDTGSGECVHDWDHDQSSTVGAMAFSPDSSHLATSGVQPITKIRIWPETLSR